NPIDEGGLFFILLKLLFLRNNIMTKAMGANIVVTRKASCILKIFACFIASVGDSVDDNSGK
ncbi:MAG: hypothetical protein ACI35O_14390, partial [Bacillaceae bacterium]